MELDSIKFEIINERKDARQIVTNGIMLDNEHTCFYGFKSVFEIVWAILNDSIIYNVTLNGEQIGIIMVSNYNDNETELEIGACFKKEYRHKGLGTELLKLVIEDCKLNGATKVHALVREDNKPSNKLCEKLNFIKYEDDQVEDFLYNNTKTKQNHYVYELI